MLYVNALVASASVDALDYFSLFPIVYCLAVEYRYFMIDWHRFCPVDLAEEPANKRNLHRSIQLI